MVGIMTRGRPVVLLLTIQLLSGIVVSPQGFFFPIFLEEQLGYTTVLVSASIAMGRLLGVVSAIIGGALSDAMGRKWTLVLGLFGLFFGSVMFVSRSSWIVILLWSVSAVGMGFHSLGGQGYLIDVVGTGRLGFISALYHWGYTLGGAISSPAAGAILDTWGFGTFGFSLAAIAFAAALAAMVLLPRLPSETTGESTSWRRSLFGYGDVFRHPLTMALGLMRFLPTCYYGMATVLNPLLINRMAASKTAVAWYGTITLILATLAQMLAGRSADRWGHRMPTLTTFAVLIVSIAGQAVFATELWSYYVFGVLGISAAWSLSTLMPVLVSDATPIEERGRVLGTLHLLWNVGMMAGSLIGGVLVEAAMGLPFIVAACLNLGAVVVTIRFFRMINPQPKPGALDRAEL